MSESTSQERLTTVLFYGFLVLTGYLVYLVFQPFLIPLGWAGVLAVLFNPVHQRFERRWGRTRAAGVSAAAVTFILIVPTLLLMVLFIREAYAAASSISSSVLQGQFSWLNRTWAAIAAHIPGEHNVDLPTLVAENAQKWTGYVAAQMGAVLRNTALLLFRLFVTLFALFYFFRDGGEILDGLRRLLPFDDATREKMLAESRDLIFASVTSGLIVAAVQGFFGGLAFALVGIGAPVFWGVVMAFFSLLPVIGAYVVWIPAAIWLFATGQTVRGIILVAICAVLVGLADNFLRPILISGRARLNGLLIFISLLGGIAAFGMLGLVLGPIVVAATASVLDVYSKQAADR